MQAQAAGAESLVAWARLAAQRDDNASAATLWAHALERAPARRAEWLREYADQLTYSGSPTAAVAIYREALARPHTTVEEERRTQLGLALALSWAGEFDLSLDAYETWLQEFPYDLTAQNGRARVLSWMNENAAAERAYDRIVRQQPSNLEAQRNFARVQSWRSRHRAATRRLGRHVHLYPDDAEAAYLLAQSQLWLGRPDRATRTLEGLLARHPNDVPAMRLRAELREQIRPSTDMRYAESHQSDDLTIRSIRVASDWSAHAGLTTLGPRFFVQHYDAESGAGITTSGIGAYGRHRFQDALEWTTWLSVDRLGADAASHARVTYDTYVTLWPHDALRFDFGSNRTTFDNIRSLRRNIVATYANVGVDVLPNELWRLVTRFNWGDYSDGNQRTWAQFVVERRLRTHPCVITGLTSTAFRFTELLDSGYFNPRKYVANGVTLRSYNVSGRRLRFDLAGMAGAEHASPADQHFIWSVGAELGIAIVGHSALRLHANHYSSATASSSGFARSSFGIAWHAPL